MRTTTPHTFLVAFAETLLEILNLIYSLRYYASFVTLEITITPLTTVSKQVWDNQHSWSFYGSQIYFYWVITYLGDLIEQKRMHIGEKLIHPIVPLSFGKNLNPPF